ncbi:Nucleoporin nup35 [Haplosporangium bisporale]|nr:Nucleoporin nup35 [Haplosporangium bisporale]KAF9215632.1 Nucleoporin nup35 [Podila verticillata]KFH69949.1 hypothetical protein, variant [Podila verticillata NRRL 6337]
MFASSSSGQSGPQGSYVPSFLIRKRLESEQEAERKRQEERTNGSHWPGPQEVLEPGYRSGPLGYIPNASQSLKSRQILGDTDLFYDASSFDAGVGLGLDALNSRPRETATPMLYPDLHGGNTTHRQSISQPSTQQSPFAGFLGDQGRRSTMKEDVLKKSSSVRFSGVPDSPRQQPTTPSVFGTSGSSPFFSSSQLGSTSLSNLSGSGKEEKIDVLSHRAAPDTTLNRSLGPAPGSVSGASQATQGYSTRTQSGDLNGSVLRDTGYSTSSSGAKSPFLMNQDGSRRQGLSGASKGLNEEEEDKDKERYMPGFLLSSGPGLKGAKVEPFIEANGSGYRDAYPRQSTQQVGDDAPPQDTLDDLARKENFYQVSRPIRFEAPKADTRQDPHFLAGSTERAKTAYDTIITYGFPADAASYILNQFRSFGTVIRHQAGIYSSKKDAFNWLLIQYNSEWSAKNATSRHLKPAGKFYVGVFPYTPAPTAVSPSAMDVDSWEDELQLSEADALELQAGVNALMTMRDTAAVDASSPFSTLAKSTSQPGAGLGNSRLGQSQSSFSASIFNATPPQQQDEGRRTTSGGDSGEEDLAHILGHSLSAGGVFGRSRRENGSLAKDALQASVGVNSSIGGGGGGGASQDSARNAFGESVQDSWTQEGSVGFKPLFGLGESRGLNTNGQDTKQHQQQQQQQQHQHQHQNQQQIPQELSGSHRLSIRRQFEDGAASGPIFGESGTTLFGNVGSSSLSGVSGSGATPFGIQKKQRLTLNTFSASAPASSVPGQFGPDRKSFLVDDPSLVDEYGQPKRVGPTNGGGGETMVGGFINTVKKRLFWG